MMEKDIDFNGCKVKGRNFTTWLEIIGLEGTLNGLAMDFT